LIAVLGPAVVALTAAVGVLVIALTIVRGAIRRRNRREQRFRPAASQALAMYVADVGPAPAPGNPGERAALRSVALTALADLTGQESERVTDLLADLGYVEEAMARLKSRRRSRRRRAAEELARVQSVVSIGTLIAGLEDSDVLVRTSCARVLAEIGDAVLAARIAEVAAHDMELAPGAAAAVVLALGRYQPAALGALLVPAAPALARVVAVKVAGRLRLTRHVQALRECLSGGADVAAEAARGLGLIGDIGAIPGLRAVARDQRRPPRVRAAAAAALGSIGDPSAAGELEPLLSAADWSLRAAAAQALASLGRPGEAVLRRAVRASEPEAREQAEAVLAR
jgi:HEAT repeat protein